MSRGYSCHWNNRYIHFCQNFTQPLKVISSTDNSNISAKMPSEMCRKLLLAKERYEHNNLSADEYFNTLCLLLQFVTQSAFATRKRRSRESKITRCSHNNNTTLLLPVWTKATETYDLESTPGRHTLTKSHVCMHYLSLAPAKFFKTFFPQNTAMLSLWHNPQSQNIKKTHFPQQLRDVFCSFWMIQCLRLPPGE